MTDLVGHDPCPSAVLLLDRIALLEHACQRQDDAALEAIQLLQQVIKVLALSLPSRDVHVGHDPCPMGHTSER